MKIDQLRKIIREEVRAAVKEELQDMLTEAVKIASTPQGSSNTLVNSMQEVPKGQPKKWSVGKSATLDEMLKDTKANMTREDASNLMGSGVQKPNFASMMSNQMVRESQGPPVGIDITKLDFVTKAKSVLDLANQKSKNRL